MRTIEIAHLALIPGRELMYRGWIVEREREDSYAIRRPAENTNRRRASLGAALEWIEEDHARRVADARGMVAATLEAREEERSAVAAADRMAASMARAAIKRRAMLPREEERRVDDSGMDRERG